MHIHVLPVELLSLIFRLLNFFDICINVAHVCKHWRLVCNTILKQKLIQPQSFFYYSRSHNTDIFGLYRFFQFVGLKYMKNNNCSKLVYELKDVQEKGVTIEQYMKYKKILELQSSFPSPTDLVFSSYRFYKDTLEILEKEHGHPPKSYFNSNSKSMYAIVDLPHDDFKWAITHYNNVLDDSCIQEIMRLACSRNKLENAKYLMKTFQTKIQLKTLQIIQSDNKNCQSVSKDWISGICNFYKYFPFKKKTLKY